MTQGKKESETGGDQDDKALPRQELATARQEARPPDLAFSVSPRYGLN
jgi:hypothetical protein